MFTGITRHARERWRERVAADDSDATILSALKEAYPADRDCGPENEALVLGDLVFVVRRSGKHRKLLTVIRGHAS